MEFDRTNTGTLAVNQKKREGKKDSDYSGSINFNGVEYWLNAWIKEGTYGQFFSLSVGKPKQPKTGGEVRNQEMPF